MKMTEEKRGAVRKNCAIFELEEIMKKYDIIIVGAGASGVFMSYELAKLDIDASVLMLDKGAPLEKRQCPIKKEQATASSVSRAIS